MRVLRGALHREHRKIWLTDDTGRSTEPTMSDELLRGGVFRWNGRRVQVFPAAEISAAQPVAVAALRLAADPRPQSTVLGL